MDTLFHRNEVFEFLPHDSLVLIPGQNAGFIMSGCLWGRRYQNQHAHTALAVPDHPAFAPVIRESRVVGIRNVALINSYSCRKGVTENYLSVLTHDFARVSEILQNVSDAFADARQETDQAAHDVPPCLSPATGPSLMA